jgi:phosphatidylserine decarboxylase
MGSPKTKKGFHEAWFAKVINKVNNEGGYFHPVNLELQKMIEGNTWIYMLLSAMFQEPRRKPVFLPRAPKIITPDTPQIRDYRHFLKILDHLLFIAPP